MRILQILIICTALLSEGKCGKSEDEGRPYEFGFTIDGEQHRYEKKDANGIIQGEFGFITADGIYHVTTYATDENGSFRILSMRNVRISDPLDGSGGTYANKVPASSVQHGGNKPQSQQQVLSPVSQNQPAIEENVIPPNNVNQVTQATTRRPIVFTTQPTIKPACAGCGYVTQASTTKIPISQRIETGKQNQNQVSTNLQSNQPPPIFQPVDPSGDVTTGTFSQSDKYKPGVAQLNIPQQPQQPPSLTAISQPLQIPPRNFMEQVNEHTTVPHKPVVQASAGPLFPLPVGPAISPLQTPSPFVEPPSISQQQFHLPQKVNQFNSISNPSLPGTQGTQNDSENLPVNSFSNLAINTSSNYHGTPPGSPTIPSRASDIKVENGMIIVPNNPPIPIKDKYPGMADGLPEGIEKQDIVDLLYKFNYTVGFHGHYEKGLRNGTKIGGYFVNGRDGISRIVTYVADELGYRPKFRLINLGLDSPDTPKEGTERTFGLKNFEFVWYPLK